MTRRYEIVYIFDSALDETQVNASLGKHHTLLKSPDNPEPVKNVNHWGKRSLAYPINNAQVGYYAVADFHTDPALLPEFERALKLDESIIRYLTVLNEGEVGRPMPHPSDDDRDSDGDRRPRRDRSESPAGARPDKPDTATAKPDKPDTTAAKPDTPDTTAAKPDTPDATAAKPDRPDATGAKPDKPDAAGKDDD